MKKLIAVVYVSVLIQGCATSYHAKSFSGGYSDTQLDQNIFNVSFNGNGYTSREKVADLALLRSAELTLQHGYRYFAVVSGNSYTSRSSYTTPTTSRTTGSAYAYGNYATGSATTTTTGGQTYNISKPGSTNTIVCFKYKPESVFTYNADFVRKSIADKYGIDKFEK